MLENLKNIKSKNLIYLDIETRAQVAELDEDSQLYDLVEYTHRYKKEMNDIEDLHKAYKEKAALFPEMGQVCCISVGFIVGDTLRTTSFYGKDEKEILTNFKVFLDNLPKKYKELCTFAGNGFDNPFLILRMLANNITEIPRVLDESNKKPWEMSNVDLKDLSRLGRFSPSSLLGLATLLGLPSPKDVITGSEVSKAFFDGRLEEIKTYCEKDTLTTANCLLRMQGLPILTLDSVEYVPKVEEKEYKSEIDKLFATGELDQKRILDEGKILTDKDEKLAWLELLKAVIENEE